MGMSKIIVIVVASAFAACGGTTNGASVKTADELATRIGCTNIEKNDKILVRESVSCDFNDESLEVDTFNTNKTRDQVASIDFGGVKIVGEKWVVFAHSQATADMVKAKVGGSIR